MRFTKSGQTLAFFHDRSDKEPVRDRIYNFADENNLHIENVTPYVLNSGNRPSFCVTFRRRDIAPCAECGCEVESDYLCEDCRGQGN